MGRPAHKPTDKDRQTVEVMSAGGIPQENISRVLGIDLKTLRKHYREELDTASDKANARVAQSLYQQAINGNVSAGIWWSKTRMGWKERQSIEHEGNVTINIKKFDD